MQKHSEYNSVAGCELDSVPHYSSYKPSVTQLR